MARGVNRVTLIGNLGGDPETNYTNGGTAVCKFSIATTEKWKDKEGNQKEDTQWHRIVIFGKLGEIADEYLKKGRQVYIEGKIRYGKYTDKEGIDRYSTDIIADEMQMLGGGNDRDERGSGSRDSDRDQRQSQRNRASEANREREAPPAKSSDFGDDFQDDDIPF